MVQEALPLCQPSCPSQAPAPGNGVSCSRKTHNKSVNSVRPSYDVPLRCTTTGVHAVPSTFAPGRRGASCLSRMLSSGRGGYGPVLPVPALVENWRPRTPSRVSVPKAIVLWRSISHHVRSHARRMYRRTNLFSSRSSKVCCGERTYKTKHGHKYSFVGMSVRRLVVSPVGIVERIMATITRPRIPRLCTRVCIPLGMAVQRVVQRGIVDE